MLGHHVFSFEVRLAERYILAIFSATLKNVGEKPCPLPFSPSFSSFSPTHCKDFVKKRIFVYQFIDNSYQYHYHSHKAKMGKDVE
jgi:hypothetical protein